MTEDANNKELCISLLGANDEDEVEQILEKAGYLDNDMWKPLGDIQGNHSIVGNQQNNAVAALVEKIVNSIDAVLLDECLKREINPRGDKAPQNMNEAIERFFGIEGGDYSKCDTAERTELSMRIRLVATGSKDYPCYTIIDTGEGQKPDNLSNTILSLPGTRSASKSQIPFVQGLFNMGGTGVLPFCGKPGKPKNYQFVLSKRDPKLPDSDNTWGFTIVRRRRPDTKHTSSTYQYLCPGGRILSFTADTVPMLPAKSLGPSNPPKAYQQDLNHGTAIKLYNYQIGSFATNVLLDLLYELGRYLFRPGVPFRVHETRDYKSNYYETTVAGMHVRLEENQSDIMERDFPSSAGATVPEIGELPMTIYALKKNYRESHYIDNKAVQFLINGQLHAYLGSDFLRSEQVDKSYIDKDVMVVVDCTMIPDSLREDLFMPSRDRLRDGIWSRAILDQLRDALKNHQGLIDLNNKRREEALQEEFAENKPVTEVLSKLVAKSPTLGELFSLGNAIEKPSDFEYKLDKKHQYKGEYFPTFFRVKGDKKVFECHSNRSVTVTLETDAQNDYFSRSKDKGKGPYIHPALLSTNFTLWNGIAKLRIKPNKRTKEGNDIPVEVKITDPSREEAFLIKFTLKITEAKEPVPRGPRQEEEGNGPEVPGPPKDYARKKVETNEGEPKPAFRVPKIIELKKDDPGWVEFGFDGNSGVHIVKSGEDYDVFVNMDNEYYLSELRSAKGGDQIIVRNQYKFGLALASLSMIYKMRSETMDGNDLYGIVDLASKGLAMTMVSLIKTLGRSQAKNL